MILYQQQQVARFGLGSVSNRHSTAEKSGHVVAFAAVQCKQWMSFTKIAKVVEVVRGTSSTSLFRSKQPECAEKGVVSSEIRGIRASKKERSENNG